MRHQIEAPVQPLCNATIVGPADSAIRELKLTTHHVTMYKKSASPSLVDRGRGLFV